MRVFLVVWGFEAFGGMEQHVLQLASGLHRAGIDVAVFSEMPVSASNAYGQQLRDQGIPLYCPALHERVFNGLELQFALLTNPGRRAFTGALLSRRLLKAIERHQPHPSDTVLHIHGCRLGQMWLLEWASTRGLATVYTEHVDISHLGGPLEPEAPRQALAATELSCVSQHAREDLMAILPTSREVSLAGHIVPHRAIRPRTTKSNALQILSPARLEAHKGVDVLLQAFAPASKSHPGTKLVLAGDGRDRRQLQSLARSLNLDDSVEFRGRIEPQKMAHALDRCDVFVLSSRSEGLPVSLLEAMEASLPIVATAAGGIPELLHSGENGLLVEPGNVEQLAAALDLILRDAELRVRLGEAARQSFEASVHHESVVVPAMLALYERARQQVILEPAL